MLHPKENAAQQNRERLVPVFDRDVFERSGRAAEAGVIVDDVEAAEFLERAIDEGFHIRLGRDVGFLEDRVRYRSRGNRAPSLRRLPG